MYKKNKTAEWVKFAILLIFALLVLYPLIWMVGSSFKRKRIFLPIWVLYRNSLHWKIMKLAGDRMEG